MAELAGLVQRLEAAVGRLESMSSCGGGPAAGGGKEPPSDVAPAPPPGRLKNPETRWLDPALLFPLKLFEVLTALRLPDGPFLPLPSDCGPCVSLFCSCGRVRGGLRRDC